MIVRTRSNGFIRDYNKKYEPETDIECAICGHGIVYWTDMALNEENQICHIRCLNKHMEERDYESKDQFQ